MKFCITMERVQRISVEFEADGDDEAQEKAVEIYDQATPADFEKGTEEHDYALCDHTGRTLVDWS